MIIYFTISIIQQFNENNQQKRLATFYPMKLMTTKCKMICAKMKSANPLSGLIPSNWDLFCGLTCNLRHTPRMNDPTHEIKPERNALKGKVPTKQQYRNWMTPVKKT